MRVALAGDADSCQEWLKATSAAIRAAAAGPMPWEAARVSFTSFRPFRFGCKRADKAFFLPYGWSQELVSGVAAHLPSSLVCGSLLACGSPQAPNIKPEHVKALKTSQLQQLTPTQVAGMPPEVVKNLSSAQLKVDPLAPTGRLCEDPGDAWREGVR